MSEEIIIDGVSSENGFISNPKRGFTTEITRLKQENEFLIRIYEASLKNNEAKALSWIEFQGCKKENEWLKSELHSKTEYIQEQRNVIEQYRNEIKMYKKCQGKRPSKRKTELRKALEEIKNNCVEILATIEEEGKPNHSIVDTIWCKNIPCCTLWELVEGMQSKINEVLDER